jgi:hypothetical protein
MTQFPGLKTGLSRGVILTAVKVSWPTTPCRRRPSTSPWRPATAACRPRAPPCSGGRLGRAGGLRGRAALGVPPLRTRRARDTVTDAPVVVHRCATRPGVDHARRVSRPSAPKDPGSPAAQRTPKTGLSHPCADRPHTRAAGRAPRRRPPLLGLRLARRPIPRILSSYGRPGSQDQRAGRFSLTGVPRGRMLGEQVRGKRSWQQTGHASCTAVRNSTVPAWADC